MPATNDSSFSSLGRLLFSISSRYRCPSSPGAQSPKSGGGVTSLGGMGGARSGLGRFMDGGAKTGGGPMFSAPGGAPGGGAISEGGAGGALGASSSGGGGTSSGGGVSSALVSEARISGVSGTARRSSSMIGKPWFPRIPPTTVRRPRTGRPTATDRRSMSMRASESPSPANAAHRMRPFVEGPTAAAFSG